MLIYDLSFEQLEQWVVSQGEKPYRAKQIWHFLYQMKVATFEEMHNLPQTLIEALKEAFKVNALEFVLKSVSRDGTVKQLYSVHDGHLIEAVLMKHHYGNSICVTTQVGCNIGCSFCASGQLQKKRDLTAGEIIAQIIETERQMNEKIQYIVVMGIGEPFDNYKHLTQFLKTVNDPKGLSIGARHITVSTSGIVPKIKAFAELGIQVNLAISLHAPNDEIRTSLMKINKTYNVDRVLDAVREYLKITNRRVTFEYIMIHELNDSVETAVELANKIKGMNAYVNLIPYNEVIEAPYKRSSRENMEAFYDVLKKHKIQVTLRKEQGHDINAACGQLRSQHAQKEML
ncbi:MAG: 23S rRNA (adenine(2503)-C(2))-methyltransferase RlmN [Acholeplasmataceae bacterium]